MIMSPFVLDRNVPLIGPPKGGQIGADGDEQEGIGKGGSAGASAQQAVAAGGCLPADARELPAGEAAVEALSGGRCRWAEAPQRGTAVESCSRRKASAEGTAAGAREVRRASRRTIWADAGGGTPGSGGWVAGGCRDVATLDAGGRVVESGAEATSSPASARNTLGSWCRWTGASTHGWRSAGQRAA